MSKQDMMKRLQVDDARRYATHLLACKMAARGVGLHRLTMVPVDECLDLMLEFAKLETDRATRALELLQDWVNRTPTPPQIVRR